MQCDTCLPTPVVHPSLVLFPCYNIPYCFLGLGVLMFAQPCRNQNIRVDRPSYFLALTFDLTGIIREIIKTLFYVLRLGITGARQQYI